MIWSKEDINELIEYINKGYSNRIIAPLIGRSYNSIHKKVTILKLRHGMKRVRYKLPHRDKNGVINEEGNVYGHLTVIKRVVKPNKSANTYWLCRCSCGTEKVILGTSLRSGSTKSCGCINKAIPIKAFMLQYQRNAFKRKIEWELTLDEFANITSMPCHYCGQPADHKYYGGYIGNGVDRKTTDDSYNVHNCVPCCEICNRAKSDMSFDDFEKWLQRICVYRCPSS